MNDGKEVVIVTGSSGYIGSALIHEFAEKYRLVGFDRENPPHPPPVAECVCIDVTSDSSVEAALPLLLIVVGVSPTNESADREREFGSTI